MNTCGCLQKIKGTVDDAQEMKEQWDDAGEEGGEEEDDDDEKKEEDGNEKKASSRQQDTVPSPRTHHGRGRGVRCV